MADGDTMTKQAEPPGGHEPPLGRDERVIPRGVGGHLAGDDPTAPAVVAEDAAFVGSAQPTAISGLEDAPPVLGAGSSTLGTPRSKARIGDRVFAALTTGAAGFVIILVALVGGFLVIKAAPSIAADKVNFLTSSEWDTTPGQLRFGIGPLLYTTVAVSLLALLLAVPVAIGIALFITQYAPRRIARPVAYAVDLLAAVPSIVYGIWGIRVLAPHLKGVQNALHVDSFPLLANKAIDKGTVFDGGVVLAIMILPIITAISRDVFERTPAVHIEGAWALGATKWEMVRLTVLPYGRAGVISGAMLGLGRALGETIAIYLILSKVSHFSLSLFSGGETFASKIANSSSEFSNPESTGAYIAAGLVLFVLTFFVNAAARAIVNRRKDFV